MTDEWTDERCDRLMKKVLSMDKSFRRKYPEILSLEFQLAVAQEEKLRVAALQVEGMEN